MPPRPLSPSRLPRNGNLEETFARVQALLHVQLRRRPRSCGQAISSYSEYGIPVLEGGTSHSLIPSSRKFQSTMRRLDNADEARKVCIAYIFTDPGFYTIIMIVNVMQEGQFTFIDFLDLRIWCRIFLEWMPHSLFMIRSRAHGTSIKSAKRLEIWDRSFHRGKTWKSRHQKEKKARAISPNFWPRDIYFIYPRETPGTLKLLVISHQRVVDVIS